MAHQLLVPIHLDALLLERDETVLEAMADFSRLPFFNGQRDVNPQVAYVGEEIVSHPFRGKQLTLGPGVHLHWALPDALTQGVNTRAGLVFPAVPDRWLVTRSGPAGPEKQWIVESDYLHPQRRSEQEATPDAVSFPLPPRPERGEHQPYRYLGRSWEVGAGRPGGPAEYLSALVEPGTEETDWHRAVAGGLTAIGYGEPAFAAFYPNCRGVFGLHDADVDSEKRFKQVSYDLIGWYDQPWRDCLRDPAFQAARAAIELRIRNEHAASGLPQPETIDRAEVWHEALALHFQWVAAGEEKTRVPDSIVCYAALTPAPDETGRFGEDPARQRKSIDIAVGNNASEALSAYLATRVRGDKAIVEEQLESLDLGHRLEHRQLDIGPKLLEARHDKGFRSIRSGILWTVKLERDRAPGDPAATSEETHTAAQPPLPAHLAHTLNRLNEAQRRYQRALDEIDSLRREIYHDWTLFMTASRPPEWLAEDFPAPVKVARFIEKAGLLPLRRKLTAAGSLTILPPDEARDAPVTGASVPPLSDPGALASILKDSINELVGELDQANRVLNGLALLDDALAASHGAGAGEQAALEAALVSFLDRLGLAPADGDSLQTLRNRIHDAADGLASTADLARFADQLDGLGTELPSGDGSRQQVVKMRFVLRRVDGPRYYRPTDPVVLMAGDAVRPTQRHGTDGKLECRLLADAALAPMPAAAGELESFLTGIKDLRKKILESTVTAAGESEVSDGDRVGARRWRHQPWHPFLMEWEVEMLPTGNGSNRGPHRRAYATRFVADNYDLPETAVDLATKPSGSVAGGSTDTGIYSGSCILTDFAPELLRGKLRRYLEKAGSDADATLAEVEKTLDGLETLSQALDGFNEALLQRHRILQLPIADPIGFADMKPLTDAVRAATAGRHSSSPLRGTDFTPIRAGELKLRRLRLVDTFGRVKSVLDPDSAMPVVASETLRSANRQSHIDLRPRLLQAARLNFRWLSAEHADGTEMDEPETNAHPAFTPVCGWLLPNNLDGSLEVYDNRGRALGAISGVGGRVGWQPAPGGGVDAWDIAKPWSSMNPHLRKLVNTIVNDLGEKDPSFLDHFLAAINNALETIAPEDFYHHQSLALLMGRPIAVVRAMLDLELRGRPAVSQSLDVVLRDMNRAVDRRQDPTESTERRAQFNLATTEKPAFMRALHERDASGIRPAFARRNIGLPPDDGAIRITPETLEGRDGLWKIHLPGRTYMVRRQSEAIQVYLETDRTTDDFTHVRFPIRIGEDQQLNDGLVGYWVEEVDGGGYHYKDNLFYAPQAAPAVPVASLPQLEAAEAEGDQASQDEARALVERLRARLDRRAVPEELARHLENAATAGVTIEKAGHRWRIDTEGHVYTVVKSDDRQLDLSELLDSPSEHIQMVWKEPINLAQSIDDPPQKLTLLVDPQGPVHAVSGILPTKAVGIPADQYAAALENLEITFLSTPILTERESTRLPLAAEGGYRWSWLTRSGGAWAETREIDKTDTRAHFAHGQRIVEGWLKLRKPNARDGEA